MNYKHTKRSGFILGFINLFTIGLFFLICNESDGLDAAGKKFEKVRE